MLRVLTQVFVRGAILSAGLVGVLYALAFCQIDAQEHRLEGVADAVIRGEPFSVRGLADVLPRVAAVEAAEPCHPKGRRSAAIIRLDLLQDALDRADRSVLDRRVDEAAVSIKGALECLPSDSFLWFAYYYVLILRDGFQDRSVDYLQRSYELGPHEGWIGVKRNAYALAVVDHLPAALRATVVREFASLLESGFVIESYQALIGPGWKVRDELIGGLIDVSAAKREAFAKELFKNGFDVAVPGVALPELRPWR